MIFQKKKLKIFKSSIKSNKVLKKKPENDKNC